MKTFFLLSSLFCTSLYATTDIHIPNPKVWFKGSVEEAFAHAKKTEKPVFLYWGAIWCPPCNEIKNEVFSKPEFAGLMKSVVPVYLDGDSEAAQIWGEKLQASGYPTLLLLDSNSKELLRLSSAVSYKEFADVFTKAVTQKQSLQKLIQKATAGKAVEAEWQIIANSDLSTGPLSKSLKGIKRLQTLQKLIQKAPSKPLAIRTLLKQSFIVEAIELIDSKNALNYPSQFAAAKHFLNDLLKDPQQHLAARSMIAFYPKEVLTWYKTISKEQDFQKVSQSWLSAAKSLRKNYPNLSADTILWSYYSELVVHELTAKNPKVIPKAISKDILQAVKVVDNASKSRFQRKSVVSGAAYLLSLVGLNDKAEKILLKESSTSSTAWYYYSSLSSLAKRNKQNDKAIEYMEKSLKKAEGHATKIQVLRNTLRLYTELKPKGYEKQLTARITELYRQLTSHPDGFVGRNRRATVWLEENLKELKKAKVNLKTVAKNLNSKCETQLPESKVNCKKHFSLIM